MGRHVHPGSEDEFRAWDRRIRAAASSYAGFLGSEVQPPNPSHPGEWITVYSFETVTQLNVWLDSDQRSALIAEGADLIDGTARIQQVAGIRATPQPATVVFWQYVPSANHDEFAALHDDMIERLQGFPGFLRSELLLPVDGVQDEHVIVASFASRPDLDRWLESDVRREWLDKIENVVEGERTLNVVGGFGGWFPSEPSRPGGTKRWKQAIAVFIALFPTTLIITFVRGEVAPDMNVVLAVLVGNVLGILTLTYVLMPLITYIGFEGAPAIIGTNAGYAAYAETLTRPIPIVHLVPSDIES